MNNGELHYATPLMRMLNLIHQRIVLDHPLSFPWDSDVTMDFETEEWASLLLRDDALQREDKRREHDREKQHTTRHLRRCDFMSEFCVRR